jgi:hypothetical protein
MPPIKQFDEREQPDRCRAVQALAYYFYFF